MRLFSNTERQPRPAGNLKCLHFNVFLDYGKDMELGFICFKVYTDTDSGRHLSITAVLWLPG
jgi:hypothetical protein